jgi:hypothetical protein
VHLIFALRDTSLPSRYQRVYECEVGHGRLWIRWRQGSCERLIIERAEPLPESVVSMVDGYVRMRLLRVDVVEGGLIVWRGYLVRVQRSHGVYRYEFAGYRSLSPDWISLFIPDGTRGDTVFRWTLERAFSADSILDEGLRYFAGDTGLRLADCPVLVSSQVFTHARLSEVWDWLEQVTGYKVLEGDRSDLGLSWAYAFLDWGSAGEEPLLVRPVMEDMDVDYSGVANEFVWRGGAPLPPNLVQNPHLRGEPLIAEKVLTDDDFASGWALGGGAEWVFQAFNVYTGSRAVKLFRNAYVLSPPIEWDDREPNVLRVDFHANVPSGGMDLKIELLRDGNVEQEVFVFALAGAPGWKRYSAYFPLRPNMWRGHLARLRFTSLLGQAVVIDAITATAAAIRATNWRVSPYTSVIYDDDFSFWSLEGGASLINDRLRGNYALRLPQNSRGKRNFVRPRTSAAPYITVRLFYRAASNTLLTLRTEASADGNNWYVVESESLALLGDGSWRLGEVILSATAVDPSHGLRLVVENNTSVTVDVDGVTAIFTLPAGELPSIPVLSRDVARDFGLEITRLHTYPSWGDYGLSQTVSFSAPVSGNTTFDVLVQFYSFMGGVWRHALLEIGGNLYDMELIPGGFRNRFRLSVQLNNVNEVTIHLLTDREQTEGIYGNAGLPLAAVYMTMNAPSFSPHPDFLYGERIESVDTLPITAGAGEYANWIHDNWLKAMREVEYGFRDMAELQQLRAKLEQRYGEPEEVLELELPYEGDARLLMPHRYLWQVGTRLMKVAELEFVDGVVRARLGRVLPTLPELFRKR